MKKLKALERLEESISKLPSIGKKSAERIAYAMLNMPNEDLEEFSNAILSLKKKVHECPICGALTEDDICEICSDSERDNSLLMVVSYPKDVIAFENAKEYNGLYHVLNGVISLNNVDSINSLSINPLLERIEKGNISEVILSTNPTIEGETTALYLAKLISKYPVKVSRIAYGLPMGGSLDYTDSETLSRALEGRRKL